MSHPPPPRTPRRRRPRRAHATPRWSHSSRRSSRPSTLSSARYAQDFNEVQSVGALNSATRNANQTETARFWQLDTPVAMWDRVADQLLMENHRNLLQSARILALTNISITDAIIAVFEA